MEWAFLLIHIHFLVRGYTYGLISLILYNLMISSWYSILRHYWLARPLDKWWHSQLFWTTYRISQLHSTFNAFAHVSLLPHACMHAWPPTVWFMSGNEFWWAGNNKSNQAGLACNFWGSSVAAIYIAKVRANFSLQSLPSITDYGYSYVYVHWFRERGAELHFWNIRSY